MKFLKNVLFFVFLFMLLNITTVFAQNNSDILKKLLAAPEGTPFDFEYKDGVLDRLKVKASAVVPSNLRGARGDKFALDSATRKARAAFSAFLNSDVIAVETGTDSVSIVAKDSKEAAQYSEGSSSTVTVNSKSFQRGLITILQHFEGSGDNRICVVVLGWSKKLVTAGTDAEKAMGKPDKVSTGEPKVSEGNMDKTKMGDMDF